MTGGTQCVHCGWQQPNHDRKNIYPGREAANRTHPAYKHTLETCPGYECKLIQERGTENGK